MHRCLFWKQACHVVTLPDGLWSVSQFFLLKYSVSESRSMKCAVQILPSQKIFDKHKSPKCVGQILPAAYSCGLLMATPVSTCCTQQLKDHQLISIFFKENYILLIKAQLPQLWYSVWIREGVSGISRRGTERLLTQSQPLCTVYSIAFPPEQRGVSCISDEFWSQLLPDIDATVHRSVLQLMQCICWSERLLSQNCYVRLYKRGSEWMRKQVEILSSDCLSCTAEQLRPRAVSCFLLSRFKIASIRNNILIRGC